MLRFTLRRLAVSSFSLFMMEQKTNPALVGLPVGHRGRLLGRLYRGLSPRDRKALEKRAQAHPGFKRKPKKAKKPAGKSRYSRFVKKHVHDKAFKKMTPQQRLGAVAALWREKHGITGPAQKAATGKAATVLKKASKTGKAKAAAPTKRRATSAKKKVKAAAKAKRSKVAVKKVSPKRLKAMLKSKKIHKVNRKATKSRKAAKPTKARKAAASKKRASQGGKRRKA